MAIAKSPDGVDVDDESNEAASDGAECATMCDDWAGKGVEREQKDDVRGEEECVEAVVDRVSSVGQRAKKVARAAR